MPKTKLYDPSEPQTKPREGRFKKSTSKLSACLCEFVYESAKIGTILGGGKEGFSHY